MPKGGVTDRLSRERWPKARTVIGSRKNTNVMSGHAPANQPRLSLRGSERVKPERNWVSGETFIGGRDFARASIAEPPCTDPYARWCGRGRRVTAAPIPMCAEHVQQFGGESPLTNLMEVKV